VDETPGKVGNHLVGSGSFTSNMTILEKGDCLEILDSVSDWEIAILMPKESLVVYPIVLEEIPAEFRGCSAN
jgi:hypothetical protein